MGKIRRLVLYAIFIGMISGFLQTAKAENAAPRGATVEERLESLDHRQRILERNWEREKEAAQEKAKSTSVSGAGKEGFFLKSADGGFQLKLRGYIQADGRFFLDDEQKPVANTFLLRRVRPIIEGTVNKHFGFYINPDFGGGKTELQDAYLDFRYKSAASLRAGKFKAPVGLERLQSGTDLLFVERALPTNLVPNRDLGIQLHGNLFDGALSYAVGIFNGVPDGASGDSDNHDDKDGAARIFAHPFKNTGIEPLKGLGLGIAGSYGTQRGSVGSPNLPSFKTPGQQTFFSYLAGGGTDNTTIADGNRARISPQGYYYRGPFGLLGEYVRSAQEVKKGSGTSTVKKKLVNDAWQVAASFVLTGENASYKGVSPKNPFDPVIGRWGAVELAARYSRLKVDDDAFPVFADIRKSAREAKSWAGGVNWHLNRNVKIVADYEQTTFTGGNTGDRESEKVILSRFQIAY